MWVQQHTPSNPMQIFYVVEKISDGDSRDTFAASIRQLLWKDSQASRVGCGDSLDVAVARLQRHAKEAMLHGHRPSDVMQTTRHFADTKRIPGHWRILLAGVT